MREPTRDSNSAARLGCEALEDRATPAAAYGLSDGSLLAFDTATPASATTMSITGVRANEALVGIDFRPQDNALYALGVNAAANTGTLYTVATATGAATAVGTPGRVAFVNVGGAAVDLPDADYGFDFDPVNDQANVVTGSGLNFRIDPTTGAAVDGNTGAVGGVSGVNTDGAINGLPNGSTGVSATAFASNRGQIGATVQYTLDAGNNALFIQDRLSSGTQTARVNVTSGGAPLDFTGANGFDIADGVGYAALTTTSGGSRLYRIDLISGAATDLGAPPQALSGLAVGSPAGQIAFTGAAFTASETGLAAEITLTRTGGTGGAANVTVTATDGTATAGSDFLPGPYTVAFAAGQSTATLVIPLEAADGAEPDESFALALSAPTGGATLGTQATATVTITDATPAAPPVTTAPPPLGFAVGAGSGGLVKVFNADQTVQTAFQPFGPDMLGGVRVARGDVTGDGVDDIIVAPVVGAPHVKVFDGVTGAEIRSFLAFDPGFMGAITIAAGDVNGDGFADIIVGTAYGSSHVRVFDGRTGADLQSFFAFGGFGGGITVASGDVNGDGLADVIAGTATGNSHVMAFAGGSGRVLQSAFAFRGYAGGVNVASGDVNGDGLADIIVGTAVGNSQVRVLDGQTGGTLQSFRAFAPSPGGSGVNVSARDVNRDGLSDILVGNTIGPARVTGFDGGTAQQMNSFLAFGNGFQGGVFIN